MIIIGGGFSGTMLAAQLARRGVRSLLVEDRRPGRGAAYSTDDPSHLLNVRAGNMSAWPDRPGDFAEALGSSAGEQDGFARRTDYGDYLAAALTEAEATGLASRIEGRAVRAQPNDAGWTVTLEGGREVGGRLLALATGNPLPAPIATDDRAKAFIVDDPWGAEGRARLASAADAHAPVLVAGMGLTMVDVVLSLRWRGHRGSITAVSRRGLLPRAHGAASPPPPVEPSEVPERLGPLMRWIRERAANADWRGVVDSLRPHSQRLWHGFTIEERSRFLRHARPWWDIHRHRLAPSVAARIDEAKAGGQLDLIAGRIDTVTPNGEVLQLAIRRRGDGTRIERRAALLVNCTGPRGPRAEGDALFGQLIVDGLVAIDPLGLGFEVDEQDRLAGRTDAWAIGPPTKGRYWEMTAVPDIRVQAERVALSMTSVLQSGAADVTP